MKRRKLKVFISRELSTSSPLMTLKSRIDLMASSLLEFTPVPFSTLPDHDWIFFYSQQGVRHFFAQWKNELTSRIAAFGPKTGLLLKEFGQVVSFTGDGTAENTANAFSMLCRGQKVLFIRAEHSRKSLQQELQDFCDILDLVVYHNQTRKDISIPESDILIFTSPLNAYSYYSVKKPTPDQTIIAIGNTTRQALLDLGVREVLTPEEPTESAITQLLRNQFSL